MLLLPQILVAHWQFRYELTMPIALSLRHKRVNEVTTMRSRIPMTKMRSHNSIGNKYVYLMPLLSCRIASASVNFTWSDNDDNPLGKTILHNPLSLYRWARTLVPTAGIGRLPPNSLYYFYTIKLKTRKNTEEHNPDIQTRN